MTVNKSIYAALELKTYSKSQLCLLFGVSNQTLNSWLKNSDDETIKRYKGKVFTPKQVDYIFGYVLPDFVYESIKKKALDA